MRVTVFCICTGAAESVQRACSDAQQKTKEATFSCSVCVCVLIELEAFPMCGVDYVCEGSQ